MIRLTRDAIDYAGLTEAVRRSSCGAVVLFLGTVRDLTNGRETVALDYEAYPAMAEKKMAEIPQTGLSSDYVFREALRAREALDEAGAKTQLWPGIDIDIPTAADHSKSTPNGTRDAVLAAFRAGSDGVLLSRKYSEMKLANLRGAGTAIRESGLA